jgi:transcriptional regulator of arginine metabolism
MLYNYSTAMDNDKSARRKALKQLLKEKNLGSHQAIVEAMHGLGFDVTQPSISRDCRDLGVIKIGGRYQLPDRSGKDDSSIFSRLIIEVLPAGDCLVVVKTNSGAAQAVAEEIDLQGFSGIVGTVAGDNTIFIATENRQKQRQLTLTLREKV